MASISDDFNRADGGLGANWTAVAGTWTVTSNAATRNATVGSTVGSARHVTSLATSDHSAQVQVPALNASTDVMSAGVACRYDAAAQTYYFASLQVETNGSASVNLGKVVAGTLTIIASTSAVATSFPETVKVQAVGSTIKAFRGGVEVLSVTDTSITTGTRVGLHGRRRASGALWSVDNFAAEDVGGGTPSPAVGTAAGTFTFTGAATGQRTPKAVASGAFTWAGAAVGKRFPRASAAGAFVWSGTAVGDAPSVGVAEGAAVGSWSYAGTAVGRRSPKAVVTGAFAWLGAATGNRSPKALAVGALSWVGTAVGIAPPVAEPAGPDRHYAARRLEPAHTATRLPARYAARRIT